MTDAGVAGLLDLSGRVANRWQSGRELARIVPIIVSASGSFDGDEPVEDGKTRRTRVA
jgi:hypothetical protein